MDEPDRCFCLWRTAGRKKIVVRQTNHNYIPILCKYDGVIRYIHPEVCKWHRQRGDDHCRAKSCMWGPVPKESTDWETMPEGKKKLLTDLKQIEKKTEEWKNRHA